MRKLFFFPSEQNDVLTRFSVSSRNIRKENTLVEWKTSITYYEYSLPFSLSYSQQFSSRFPLVGESSSEAFFESLLFERNSGKCDDENLDNIDDKQRDFFYFASVFYEATKTQKVENIFHRFDELNTCIYIYVGGYENIRTFINKQV